MRRRMKKGEKTQLVSYKCVIPTDAMPDIDDSTKAENEDGEREAILRERGYQEYDNILYILKNSKQQQERRAS